MLLSDAECRRHVHFFLLAAIRLLFLALSLSLSLFLPSFTHPLPSPPRTSPLRTAARLSPHSRLQYTKGEPTMTVSTSDGVEVSVAAMGEAVSGEPVISGLLPVSTLPPLLVSPSLGRIAWSAASLRGARSANSAALSAAQPQQCNQPADAPFWPASSPITCDTVQPDDIDAGGFVEITGQVQDDGTVKGGSYTNLGANFGTC